MSETTMIALNQHDGGASSTNIAWWKLEKIELLSEHAGVIAEFTSRNQFLETRIVELESIGKSDIVTGENEKLKSEIVELKGRCDSQALDIQNLLYEIKKITVNYTKLEVEHEDNAMEKAGECSIANCILIREACIIKDEKISRLQFTIRELQQVQTKAEEEIAQHLLTGYNHESALSHLGSNPERESHEEVDERLIPYKAILNLDNLDKWTESERSVVDSMINVVIPDENSEIDYRHFLKILEIGTIGKKFVDKRYIGVLLKRLLKVRLVSGENIKGLRQKCS